MCLVSLMQFAFQEKPDSPQNFGVTCNGTSANIQWTSSFNGGFSQTFIALVLYKGDIVSQSETMNDRGENVIHNTQLQDLEEPTRLVFYIIAQNKIGNSSSESAQCPTFEGT